MYARVYDILNTLKLGKEAQQAAWLSHPDNYDALVADVETQGQGGASDISTALSEIAENGTTDLKEFATVNYPDFLVEVVSDFSTEVMEYAADSAKEKAVVYAPALPINTTNPTSNSLASCFENCRWLTTIQDYTEEAGASQEAIASIDRLDLVTNTRSMFQGCSQLTKLPQGFVLNYIVNADSMFLGCKSLEKLPDNLEGIRITTASGMFRGCTKMKKLPDNFSLQSATTISLIFQQCGIVELPPDFEFGKATSYRRIFYGCKYLLLSKHNEITDELEPLNQSLVFDVSNLSNMLQSGAYNSSNTDSTMCMMFQGCNAIGNGEILNKFTITRTGTNGIKFDLYLHENGFAKLSAASVASLLQCLYDYTTNDPDYENRIPSGCTDGGKATPTVIVSNGMETELEEFPHPSDPDLTILDYIDELGWSIEEG